MELKPRVFSGIQPSGNLHLGNYIGAIKQWVEMQDEYDCIFCIVDLHAITMPQDPKILHQKIRELAALYLACGIDPKKSNIFVQSSNYDHTTLAWILDCVASMGQLERMTQYKAKIGKSRGASSVGLFNYPALMAADILLYETDLVPVGEDQKQHVELTRDLAGRFNSRFGEVFKIPDVKMIRGGARIMSLKDPTQKMSKSEKDRDGVIDILDSPEEIGRKITSAVTDSGNEVAYQENKPGINNLLTIYSSLSNNEIRDLEEQFRGKGYGEFKKELSKVVIEFLKPIRDKYDRIVKNQKELEDILTSGRDNVSQISTKTIRKVFTAVGLGL